MTVRVAPNGGGLWHGYTETHKGIKDHGRIVANAGDWAMIFEAHAEEIGAWEKEKKAVA